MVYIDERQDEWHPALPATAMKKSWMGRRDEGKRGTCVENEPGDREQREGIARRKCYPTWQLGGAPLHIERDDVILVGGDRNLGDRDLLRGRIADSGLVLGSGIRILLNSGAFRAYFRNDHKPHR